MRRIVFIILLSFVHDTYGQELDHDRLQQAIIFRSDNSVWLESDIKLDHRFFGYEKPDTTSGKLILFSVFTPDVEDNPYHCPLGAYYGMSGVPGKLHSMARQGSFVKIRYSANDGSGPKYFYFEKKWVQFK
ncbi:MAG: hypothetical protein U0T56_07855 [Ferruginibacter sp.]|jgi:hypothetical protein